MRLVEAAKLVVHDVIADGAPDELEFRDRVIEFAMGFGHLVVATSAQCVIYSVNNWNTPHIFDLKESVSMLKLTAKHFATVDNLTGVQVFSYEGRLMSQLKFPGLRPEFVSHATLSISNDAAACVERSAPTIVRFLDCVTGKQACKDFSHVMDVDEVLLSQVGHAYERKFCIIDRNRDLYMSPVSDSPDLVKLTTMVDSAQWNDDNDMLLALADGKLLVWYCPQAAFTDRDLLPRTRSEQDASELGKLPRCASFMGTRATIRRSDGALMAVALSPYPAKLQAYCAASEWEAALRLCRYCKDQQLWACLAAMAVAGKDYNAAEVAYAAIEEVDKLKYMLYIKELPTEVCVRTVSRRSGAAAPRCSRGVRPRGLQNRFCKPLGAPLSPPSARHNPRALRARRGVTAGVTLGCGAQLPGQAGGGDAGARAGTADLPRDQAQHPAAPVGDRARPCREAPDAHRHCAVLQARVPQARQAARDAACVPVVRRQGRDRRGDHQEEDRRGQGGREESARRRAVQLGLALILFLSPMRLHAAAGGSQRTVCLAGTRADC